MIVWHLLLAVHQLILSGGWVLILCLDMFLRIVPPYSRRMRRGKYSKWIFRKFGNLNDAPIRLAMVATMIAGLTATGSKWFVSVFYMYLVVTMAVDWITGSDDPPWRRWAESGAEILKKLRIQPAPQPVINTNSVPVSLGGSAPNRVRR